MQKLWPVLAILAAAIVAAVLVSGGEDEVGLVEDEEIVGYDEQGNPILLTADGTPRPSRTRSSEPERSEKPDIDPESARGTLFLEGLVVDGETRQPVAGARLQAELAREPCPRLPESVLRARQGQFRIPSLDPAAASTGADGRFRWMVGPHPSLGARWDVFASAKGYVMSVSCGNAAGANVTLTMQRALRQKIQVTDPHGRPVEAADLKLVPAEGTPHLPGHAGAGTTDRNGRAEIDGLLPGGLMLKIDHPAFMPTTVGPLDPFRGGEQVVRLPPAFRLKLEIRSDDASPIQNPTLAWETNGHPPHKDLVLLRTRPAGPDNNPSSELHAEPVRVPCNHREVQLEIKADGFEPFIPAAEPLPVEGGERKIILSLRRDTTLGSLRVHLEDPEGDPVSYTSLQPVPAIARMDAQRMSAGIVLETAETLFFPALPAGPYRIGVRCAKYAPAEGDVTVRAGEKNELLLKLTEPARLRLKFLSSERVMVRFRFLKQGQVVLGFRQGASALTPEPGNQPIVVEGNAGTVFSGLPAGSMVIQVTSEDLVAAPRTVQLQAGETTEAEVEVRVR